MKEELLKWIEQNKARCLDCVLLQNGDVEDWNTLYVLDADALIEFINQTWV